MQINRMISAYNHEPGSISRIKYIVIHYVGALGDARNNCEYYGGGNRNASAHYFVGFAGDIWQCVEDADIAWHVGASSYVHPECRNANALGIEMCVRKRDTSHLGATDRDWYFEGATVNAAAELTRHLMAKYNVPADHVIRHYDVTGKICPNPYVYNTTSHTWEEFKRLISTSGSAAPSTPSGGSGDYGTGLYKVNVDDLAIRTGPSAKYAQCGSITDHGTYTITEVSNTCWGKLLSGAGWICIDAEYCTAAGSAGSNAPESSAWHAAGTATCTDTGVNVRQTPGGTVIGQLGQGNRFEVDGQVSAGWVHVKVAGIGIGWVSDQYVLYDTAWKAAGTATSTADGVRVRQTPNGTILGQVDTGNRFEVDGQKSGEWIHVKVAGIGVGYIHQDYVRYD